MLWKNLKIYINLNERGDKMAKYKGYQPIGDKTPVKDNPPCGGSSVDIPIRNGDNVIERLLLQQEVLEREEFPDDKIINKIEQITYNHCTKLLEDLDGIVNTDYVDTEIKINYKEHGREFNMSVK